MRLFGNDFYHHCGVLCSSLTSGFTGWVQPNYLGQPPPFPSALSKYVVASAWEDCQRATEHQWGLGIFKYKIISFQIHLVSFTEPLSRATSHGISSHPKGFEGLLWLPSHLEADNSHLFLPSWLACLLSNRPIFASNHYPNSSFTKQESTMVKILFIFNKDLKDANT